MRPQKITFGEMRSGGGPTGIRVYCADYRCSHSMAMSADQWADDVRLSDVETRFVCKPAVSAVPMCGRTLSRRRLGPPTETALLQAFEFEREPSAQYRTAGVANLDR
jgi:hypothetical protein